MNATTALALFVATALFEILGCYLVFMWRQPGKSVWLLVPAAMSLATFAWLLTIHPHASAGRVYAAYGGIYVVCSLVWMVLIEKKPFSLSDIAGVALICAGAALIYFAPGAVVRTWFR